MEIKNNSIIDTIIEYANMKFGVELSQEAVSEQLKGLSLTTTLALIDAVKTGNNDRFLDFVDVNVEESGYGSASTLAGQSAATVDQQTTIVNQQNRQAKIQAAPRSASNQRTVAGGTKRPTGTRAPVDPNDQAQASNASGVEQNSTEINRLRSLVQQMTKGQG